MALRAIARSALGAKVDTSPTCLMPLVSRTSPAESASTMIAIMIAVFTYHPPRSEEHTSELQSLAYLVCRLLLEKKKKTYTHVCLKYKNSHSSSTRHYGICSHA